MGTYGSLTGGIVEIPTETIGAFMAGIRGETIDPADKNYDEARKVWNATVDKRPSLIVKCSGLADVVAAVNFARDQSLLLSVRGGGHNVSGSAVCDGGLVIDLSQMRAVRVDRKTQSAHVQGGATLADVDHETQAFGLVTTTGNVSQTGIGGLTLSGGFGNLRRKYGLGIDNVISVEIVTADGTVHHADASNNPELFWAVRGGGGNFGVVTSFEFKLLPLGPEVMFAAQFFAIEDANSTFRKWRDIMDEAPDEVSSLAFFWTVPRVEGFPEEIQGKRVFLYAALYAGPADEGEEVLRPLTEIGEPVLDLSGRGPYTQWQAAFDPFFIPGAVYPEIFAYWKSIYLNELSDTLIDDLIDRARQLPTEQCLMAIWQLGGAMARVPEEATAFGRRIAPYLLSYDCCWVNPKQSQAVVTWVRQQVAAAEPYSPGGSYLNFPGVGEDNDELVRKAYGKNYHRLVQIKRTYDPDNLFRMNQNIKPTGN